MGKRKLAIGLGGVVSAVGVADLVNKLMRLDYLEKVIEAAKWRYGPDVITRINNYEEIKWFLERFPDDIFHQAMLERLDILTYLPLTEAAIVGGAGAALLAYFAPKIIKKYGKPKIVFEK